MTFEQWRQIAIVGESRHFSLGRHALAVGLRAFGIGAGDKVLLPEFICRDFLAALAAVGAEPVWYPVGPDLRPSAAPLDWPVARAVLALNYFGFPQQLESFRIYAVRHGAALIEDNAHGFLSRDETGQWLGTRGDIGIFSLRKTLLMPDGAMLVTGAEVGRTLPPQLAETGRGLAPAAAIKAAVRRLPFVGMATQNALADIVRRLRRMRGGLALPAASDADETKMPVAAAPHAGLARTLARLDIDKEIARRRALYRNAEIAAGAAGVDPFFPTLPELTAPYGFAFRGGDQRRVGMMMAWARTKGLDLIAWPDLPHGIRRAVPDWYHDLRLVNFL